MDYLDFNMDIIKPDDVTKQMYMRTFVKKILEHNSSFAKSYNKHNTDSPSESVNEDDHSVPSSMNSSRESNSSKKSSETSEFQPKGHLKECISTGTKSVNCLTYSQVCIWCDEVRNRKTTLSSGALVMMMTALSITMI